jgi:hypothetical protein
MKTQKRKFAFKKIVVSALSKKQTQQIINVI